MRQKRMHKPTVGITLAVALMALPMLACGPTVFADAGALAVIGDPPPLPPPEPEPEPEPEPPRRVEVTASAIVITEKIMFEVDKAVIQPQSFDLMNEITAVMKDNPRIKKISIEGHTDSDGSNRYNKKLSNKRAAAVVAYLEEHGIDASRLTSVGHGEENPLVENDTAGGKEKNRRVEFIIVEQDEMKNVVEIDPETGEERIVDTKVEASAKSDSPAAGTKVKAGPPSRAKEGQP